MAAKALPSPEVLRQLLRYEPETGKLFWRPRPVEMFPSLKAYKIWTTRDAGKEALTGKHSQGYRNGTVLYNRCFAHRVIWAMQTGAWPEKSIDHINGDKADNRWANLREATASENAMNTGKRADNKSGWKGVTWEARRGHWVANIAANGKQKFLGSHRCPTAAYLAYCAASRAMHGAFSRVS